jgi:hypothetical protein
VTRLACVDDRSRANREPRLKFARERACELLRLARSQLAEAWLQRKHAVSSDGLGLERTTEVQPANHPRLDRTNHRPRRYWRPRWLGRPAPPRSPTGATWCSDERHHQIAAPS